MLTATPIPARSGNPSCSTDRATTSGSARHGEREAQDRLTLPDH